MKALCTRTRECTCAQAGAASWEGSPMDSPHTASVMDEPWVKAQTCRRSDF